MLQWQLLNAQLDQFYDLCTIRKKIFAPNTSVVSFHFICVAGDPCVCQHGTGCICHLTLTKVLLTLDPKPRTAHLDDANIVLHNISEPIHTNAHPNSPSLIINEQACKNVLEAGGVTRHQSIYLHCAQSPVIGPMQECVYMDAAESLPVWYGSPIIGVSFTTQPCKTKLHEIDYPHTWTSFVTPLFLPLCLCHQLSAGPCLFSHHRKINVPKMLTWNNGVLNYHSGGRKMLIYLFSAEMSEILETSYWSPFDKKEGEMRGKKEERNL